MVVLCVVGRVDWRGGGYVVSVGRELPYKKSAVTSCSRDGGRDLLEWCVLMIIAHDLGTSGNKASLHEDDGRLIVSHTEGYPTHYAPGGIVEQNPDLWWDSVVSATRQLLERVPEARSAVSAISFSGQMMGVVALDHRAPARATRDDMGRFAQRQAKRGPQKAHRRRPRVSDYRASDSS